MLKAFHYQKALQVNQKKMYKKNDGIFSIYGRIWIIHDIFILILTWAFWGRWGRMMIDVEFWGSDLEIL